MGSDEFPFYTVQKLNVEEEESLLQTQRIYIVSSILTAWQTSFNFGFHQVLHIVNHMREFVQDIISVSRLCMETIGPSKSCKRGPCANFRQPRSQDRILLAKPSRMSLFPVEGPLVEMLCSAWSGKK